MNATTFAEIPLCAPLQRALEISQYTHPTPIQAAAIPHVLAGRDVLGCAQTGTGKTAAFALPILQHLAREIRPATPRLPRVLVLAPTRELAAQIGASFRTYGKNLALRHAVIFGGVGQRGQVDALARGAHVVVATPGRLLDLMQQKHISLEAIEILVLDEADRMLDMGFLPDLRRIISRLPRERQSLFFSATMPREVAELAATLLTDPVGVQVTPVASTVERIEQRVLFTSDKRSMLRQLLSDATLNQVLIFTRTKRRANDVTRQLHACGVKADAIHGDKSQNARERALHAFRSGKLRALVATDIAARGLDVDGISHVINFDMPHEPESYVHRIGRTGRAGASGIAISLCDPAERNHLRAIERLIGRSLAGSDQGGGGSHKRSFAPSSTGSGESGSRSQPRRRRRNTGRGPARKPAHVG